MPYKDRPRKQIKPWMHRRRFGNHTYYHVESEPTKADAQARCKMMRKHGYLSTYTKESLDVGRGKSVPVYYIWRTN